jgi:hypothetical protein
MENTKPLHEILQERELTGPNFLTYTARPKAFERIETRSDLSPDGGKDTAILLTGSMVYEDHFTRDTIRLYRQHYPEALIILSTWDDEDKEYLNDLREDQVHVITNPKPVYPGVKDTEHIRIPFHEGLKEASVYGISRALRTAPSQRIYVPNVLYLLRNITQLFSLRNGEGQKDRLIASAFRTHKYLPFSISAMFMYGHIDDLLKYWDHEADSRSLPQTPDEEATVRSMSQSQPGCYFAKKYLAEIGAAVTEDSIQEHWRILAERFCLLDREMLDMYWHMPSDTVLHAAERRESNYAAVNSCSMRFNDWLILYHTQGHHPSAPEWILDMPWGEKLDFSI